MVDLNALKDYLNIDFNQEDAKLTRKLNAAIRIVERYTNLSLVAKTVTIRGSRRGVVFFGSPIISITGATDTCYNDMSVTIYAKDGDNVTVQLGAVDEPNLDEAVLRIASTLYEGIEISEVTLPLDVQLLINQFRHDDFIS